MEIWKDIEGYPGYKVSNMGRVKSYLTDVNGKLLNKRYDKDGYEMVWTKWNSACRVHRLVLLAFDNDSHFEGAVVNHKNGIKDDNRLENLEWVSISENTKHAYNLNLAKSPMSEAVAIYHNGNLISVFQSKTKLANHCKVSNLCISNNINSFIFDELEIKLHMSDIDDHLLNKPFCFKPLSRYQSKPLSYNNKYYESIKELCECLNLSRGSVLWALKKNSKLEGHYVNEISRFEYINQLDYND